MLTRSSKVLGWSVSNRINSRLACDALQMAIWTRRPEEGLIFHFDRGVQYASHEFRRLLKANQILESMSRKGDCWDNSVVESFFGKLNSEQVHWRNYRTRSKARADVMEYITLRHNSLRLHWYLGYLSLNEF